MKKIITILILIPLFSCRKPNNESKCTINQLPLDYSSNNKTLIPINTRNFWTYADSSFDLQSGTFTVTSSLISIENLYVVNNLTYFDFTQLLPPMTVIGDTLFSITTGGNTCYTLTKKLFPVTDTTRTYPENTALLYNSPDTIHTIAGPFSANTIYTENGLFTMYFHPGIGLVRTEFRLADGTLLRSLTLKDYKIF